MKTIKIIDLINKISNDEEVPKKIRYFDTIFIFNEDTCNFLYKYQAGKCQLFGCCRLNDEVEIIEEDTENKIEKIQKTFSLYFIDSKIDCESKDAINDIINELIKKVDEIIDEVNKGESNENN